MLLVPVEKPFADSHWLYQVKWDGVRNLALVESGQIRHWSRRLRERTDAFPELSDLSRLFQGRRAVLDGEIVVLRNGKPSFAGVLERDQVGRRPSVWKVRTTPATFMIFDLLEYGDQELYGVPLRERLDLLEKLVPPGERWQVVASFPGHSGPDLFAATRAQGLEGVVAKRRDSSYQPGARSRDWLKIKHRQQILAVVCGFTNPAGRPGGLILGAYREGRLVYIGRAGSGLNREELALIRKHLPRGPCPFGKEPNLRDRFSGPPGPVVWTEPRITVFVSFSDWTEDGKLRDPVVAGFSTEPPEAAQIC